MSKRILITGGAGFIGSRLADELLRQGYRVRVLDPLAPQVDGENARRPDYLDPEVELLLGSVEDAELVAVYHLAAKVGVGQSMYDIAGYTRLRHPDRRAALLQRLRPAPVALQPLHGVLAIFASQLLSDSAPIIFEDGQQRRDFVNVRDIARGCRRALEAPNAPDLAFNIGSGRHCTVAEVAARLARILGKDIASEIAQRYRVGDTRHCFADISRAREVLGYEPQVSFEDGLTELAGWLEGQIVESHFEEARNELAARGLTV